MKKRIFTSLFLGAICGIVSAQTLTVDEVEVLQNGTASYALKVDVQGGTYTGVQFNVNFGPGFDIDTDNAQALSSWVGGSALPSELNSSGAGKVSCYSDKGKAIPDGGVVLATIPFSTTAAIGEYTVNITDVVFMTEDTRKTAANTSFVIKVVDRLTLNEESTTAPETISGVNIKVKRTMKANTWSTICLPFAMTEAQVQEVFGDKASLGDFNSYDLVEDGKDIAAINVKFNSVKAIEANHPYIIKPSKAVSEFTLDNVNVAPASDEELEINLGTSRKPKSIIGNYKAGTVIENGGLFLKDGNFYYSVGKTAIKGFRAYFNFTDLLTEFEDEYATSRINITFDDVTAIKTVKTANGEEVYTLSGQRVQNAGKGVYIVNGKKVIKK